MARKLVVVESPAKARTIGRYLGRDFTVKASQGHIRDLPKGEMGVKMEDGFVPKYVIPRSKQPLVKELQEAASKATAVYLATDPDREGEAIAWHLTKAMKLDSSLTHRVVFHEITSDSVKEAFQHPRDIDLKLVDAQQARRILDRLVGYRLSPLLWITVKKGLSAGRVQSVAVRLVVEREAEISRFVPREHWLIEAKLEKRAKVEKQATIKATLHSIAGKKGKLEIPNQKEAARLKEELQGAQYTVSAVSKKEVKQRPAPPFTTSTLQQEAWRKLRFSPKKTMLLAQQLYEGLPLGSEGEVGLITYMRTDSTHVATSALAEARGYIQIRYGQEYLPKSPRSYTAKSKGAQEAHEAIRPTSVGREPERVKAYLAREQLRLYELIWKRMVASQMADALQEATSVDIVASSDKAREKYLLRASGIVLRFPGFRALYLEGQDEAEEEKATLPELAKGEELDCLGLEANQRFTQPPARYTEASLIKTLEELGIGRPSTYAPTLSTIQDREYIQKREGRLHPTELGVTVNGLLTQHFPAVVDPDFTAQMEEDLDKIARGEKAWVPVLKAFYAPFSLAVELAKTSIQPAPTGEVCDRCGKPMVVKVGRSGKFLGCSGYPECRNTKPLDGQPLSQEPTGEVCDKCGKPMVIKVGRFGKFLSCSGYPECRNAKPYLVKTGAKCPQCGGDLVQRSTKGKRKRTFYGCSNYPSCNFLVNHRPSPEPCPECGGLLVGASKNTVKCTKCNYVGRSEQKELVPAEV